MGWTVWESNPGGGRIFDALQTNPEIHPVSCTMGTKSSSGIQQMEHGVDHQSVSYVRLHMGIRYTSTSLCACVGMSRGELYVCNLTQK